VAVFADPKAVDYRPSEQSSEGVALEAAGAPGTPLTSLARLPENNDTDALVRDSLPAASRVLYADDADDAVVTVMREGTGAAAVLGWDWYDGKPRGGQDGGWMAVLRFGPRGEAGARAGRCAPAGLPASLPRGDAKAFAPGGTGVPLYTDRARNPVILDIPYRNGHLVLVALGESGVASTVGRAGPWANLLDRLLR
jgi:hypothetical protein